MRPIYCLILALTVFTKVQAQTSGCNLGSTIYTQYIGQTTFYGNVFSVYYKAGYKLQVYYNPGAAPCDQIKQSNYTPTYAGCWVADRVPPTNNQTNSDGSMVNYGGYEGIVTFASNSYTKCSVPLDEFSFLLVGCVGVVSLILIRKDYLGMIDRQ